MSRSLRWIVRLAVTIATLVAVAALALLTLSGRLPAVEARSIDLAAHPEFRTWAEHHSIYGRGDFPYIVEIDAARGAVLYIGALHSTDPDHEQWNVVRNAWNAFSPTVALNEGRARYFHWSNLLFGGISDPKLAVVLARQDSIPIYSLEPTYETEVDALLEKWPARLVACYFSLRVIVSESGGNPNRAESIAPGLIAKRTDVDGLRNALSGVSDLDTVWADYAAGEPDWRTLADIDAVELMRQIGDDSREVRGRHMLRAIVTLAEKGERVVAIVGASHVIRHEPTLRSLLGEIKPPGSGLGTHP